MAKKIILLVILLLVFIFVLQNTQAVEVQIYFWKVSMSRALMLLATFLAGIIAGFIALRFKTGKKNN